MIKLIKIVLCLTPFLLALSSCENEMEKYYERPSNLAPPILDQLEQMGRFNTYIACLEKAGFKDVIAKTAFLTVFAPNDSAFQAYFQEKNITLDDIDERDARSLITYMLLYNGYRIADFDRFQAGNGAIENDSSSYKRKTYYYKGYYYENVYIDNEYQLAAILDNNRNNGINLSDNNNKYIPIFTNSYFQFNKLTAYDYNYFFPNTEFNGQNVAGAKIIRGDIQAQNGYIHEISKVIEPLPNLDECILEKPEYSRFKEVLAKLDSFIYDPILTTIYLKTPNPPVQGVQKSAVKFYLGLSFAPNNENFIMSNENDAQKDGYTMIVPNNAAFDKIMTERIAVYYGGDYHNLPIDILNLFVRSHQFTQTVWPSLISVGKNFNEEPPRIDPATDIEESVFGSNGIFYGTNKAQDYDYFMSVYGDILLNPSTKYFKYGADLAAMGKTISNPYNKRFSLFILDDDYFIRSQFDYNPTRTGDPLFYKTRSTTATFKPQDTLKNIIYLHVTDEIPDISGKGYVETYLGDIIGYDNGKIFAAGNLDRNYYVNCTPVSVATPNNGTVYNCDTLVKLSTLNIGAHIEKYFRKSLYCAYLYNNKMYNTTSKQILDLKSNVYYTVLIPNDAAIQAAITAGDLPADTLSPEQDKVKRFILYHIIKGKSIIASGKKDAGGGFLTTLALGTGSATVTVTNTVGNLAITDMKGNTVNWDPNNSNVLSNKAVIHTLNGYLKY